MKTNLMFEIILILRFRVLHSTIQLRPDRIESVVMACCVLHNLLRIRNPSRHEDIEDPVTHVVSPGTWRDEDPLPVVPNLPGNNSTQAGKQLREHLK